jgi:shikimate dehydrogenase
MSSVHPAPARYAVVGNPVAHSRSPAIHAHFARQAGIDLEYGRLAAPLDGFRDAVLRFFAEGGRGLNVTVPFKQEAHAMAAQHLSARARLAGAVNTLWMHEGALHGCNTDGVGLVWDLLRLGARLDGARILLIGAGGAARGVLLPLADAGAAHLHIVNRTASRAHDLAGMWTRSRAGAATADAADAARAGQGDKSHADGGTAQPVVGDTAPLAVRITAGGLADAAVGAPWDIVVNASASSLGDAAPALPPGLYAAQSLAYDMMYAPNPTPFMRQASSDGAGRTADGLGMLVGQAAESFHIWHGVRPQAEPVLDALRASLRPA